MGLENIRVVLTRPKGAANLGATARAMKNMGLSDLALVEPGEMDPAWARAMAAHAVDVLEGARRFDSLAAAVADCHWVLGTTARDGGYRGHPLTPRQAGQRVAEVARRDRVALVFGPEDHGLSNDDLKECHELICIPTSTAYASLNLAQAVLVCSYEVFLAVTESQGWDWQPSRPQPAAAGDLHFLFERLQQAFAAIGFLLPENPDHIMHSLRRMLGRAQLEEREVRILLGLARQIEWYGRENREQLPAGADAKVTVDG